MFLRYDKVLNDLFLNTRAAHWFSADGFCSSYRLFPPPHSISYTLPPLSLLSAPGAGQVHETSAELFWVGPCNNWRFTLTI